ncbi:acylglycerol kinase family protein [Pseudonocardia sp. NPDC049154]|uniref:acylglycerol kinase family protein n=1 Tax=Pseudonocardia sp. NPDC049154 TaxID=3155501 RepID=UPI0033FA5B03
MPTSRSAVVDVVCRCRCWSSSAWERRSARSGGGCTEPPARHVASTLDRVLLFTSDYRKQSMTAEAAGSPHVITASPFNRIVVIFNPHSTGSAAELAEGLCADLSRRLPRTWVHLSPTEHAGHARDLARNAARTPRSLIVSVSGDGGYNEVIDGVMQAGDTGTVCAVMAAGNANDHRRTTGEQPLGDAIVAGDVRRLDLLRLTVGHGPDALVRYAHSYIGMGLTPIVAVGADVDGRRGRHLGVLRDLAPGRRAARWSGARPNQSERPTSPTTADSR